MGINKKIVRILVMCAYCIVTIAGNNEGFTAKLNSELISPQNLLENIRSNSLINTKLKNLLSVEQGDENFDLESTSNLDLKQAMPFNVIVNTILKKLSKYYMPQEKFVSENETQCINDIRAYDDQLLKMELWVIEMFDSWGKLPDGFLHGNVHVVGMFEQCVQFSAEVVRPLRPRPPYDNTTITGRYCTIAYRTPANHSLERSGPALASLASPLPFSYATCIPSSCSDEALLNSVNDTLQSVGREVASIICHDRLSSVSLDGPDIAVMVVVLLLVVVMVVATVVDGVYWWKGERDRVKEGSLVPVSWFSFFHNMEAIFYYEAPAERSLHCLHMLRAVTVLWIIVCHQYEATLPFNVNTFDALKYQEPAIAQLITDGWPSVDTFFFITGLLLGMKVVATFVKGRSMQEAGSTLAMLFIRRVLRLMPSLLMVAVFATTLYRHLGAGPIGHALETFSREICPKYWWMDVIFINNFISWGGGMTHAIEDCLDNTWYTAVDVQLTLALPLLVLPIAHKLKPGLAWLALCSVLSVILPVILTIVYDLPPGPLTNLSVHDSSAYSDYMRQLFFPPWSRTTPWLVGIWGGLALSRKKFTSYKLNKLTVLAGYVVAIIIGLVVVMGIYPYNVVPAHVPYTMAVSVPYIAFAKLGWGLALLWVVYTCYTGNAGIFNTVLAYPGWQPLSRLSFSMYLVSPLVQRWYLSMQYVPIYYSYLSKLYESCGMIFISLVMGLLLTVLVERPFRGLTDYLLLPAVVKKKRETHRRQKTEALSLIKPDETLETPGSPVQLNVVV